MPPVKKKVNLDDLSAADRERLLADARTTAEVDASGRREEIAAVETRKADARNAAIASFMSDRDHLRDCPGGRVEAYAATRPPQPAKGLPAAEVTIVRCVECGGATVKDQSYAITVAAIEEAEAAAAADVDETAEAA